MRRGKLPGYLYKRGNRWWWKVRLPGEYRQRQRPVKLAAMKLAIANKALAVEIAWEMWDEAKLKMDAEGSGKLEPLVAAFKMAEAPANSPQHLADKVRRVKAFVKFAKITEAAQISLQGVEDWLGSLFVRGLAPRTIRDYRGDLSRFCSWLVKHGHLLRNPVAATRPPKLPSVEPPVYLTRDELNVALEAARKLGLFEVWFAAYLGVRRSSLMEMRHGDLSRRGSDVFLVVRNSKGNRLHSLKLPKALVAILPYLGSGSASKKLFRPGSAMSWDRRLKPIRRAVPKLSAKGQGWHTFRRTVGSLLAQDGVSLYSIAKILGHKSTRITEAHYAHLQPELASEALEKI